MFFPSILRSRRDLVGILGHFDKAFPAAYCYDNGPSHPINLYETKDAVHFDMSAPGLDAAKLNVSVQDDELKVSYRVETEKEGPRDDEVTYFHRAIHHETFSYSAVLPYPIKSDKVTAVYKNGVLKITMPKDERAVSKKVQVQVAA